MCIVILTLPTCITNKSENCILIFLKMQPEACPPTSNSEEGDVQNRFSLQVPRRLEKHFDFIEFNNDGVLLLGASSLTGKIWSGSIWLFNDPKLAPNAEKCLAGLEFENSIASGLWLDNGSKVIVGGDTGTMQLLNLTAVKDKPLMYFTTVGIVSEHDDSILSLDSFDHKLSLISASIDMSIKIWDLDAIICEKSYSPAHSHIVTSVSCKPDSRDEFISTSLDNTSLIWDKRLEKPASLLSRTEGGYMSSAWVNDNSAVIGSTSGFISLVDIRMKAELDRNFCSKRPIHKLKYNKDLQILAVAADDPTLRVLSCKDNTLSIIYECETHTDFVRGLSWDPKTSQLYSCGWDSKIIAHEVPEAVNNNNTKMILNSVEVPK